MIIDLCRFWISETEREWASCRKKKEFQDWFTAVVGLLVQLYMHGRYCRWCITNQVMDKSGFSTTLDRDGYNLAVMSWGRSRGDDRQGLGGNT